VSDRTRTFSWKFAALILVGLALLLIPHPAGLSPIAWLYLWLFAGVIVALVLEPSPPAVVGSISACLAMALGDIAPKPADGLKWGLSGVSDGTVRLIFGALTLCT
jgi:L-tartrate/succinate antiporter